MNTPPKAPPHENTRPSERFAARMESDGNYLLKAALTLTRKTAALRINGEVPDLNSLCDFVRETLGADFCCLFVSDESRPTDGSLALRLEAASGMEHKRFSSPTQKFSAAPDFSMIDFSFSARIPQHASAHGTQTEADSETQSRLTIEIRNTDSLGLSSEIMKPKQWRQSHSSGDRILTADWIDEREHDAGVDLFFETATELIAGCAARLRIESSRNVIARRLLHEEKAHAIAVSEFESRTRLDGLYKTIGNTIPFGFWITDAKGRPSYVSESFLSLIGMSLEDYAQFKWLSLVPATMRDGLLEDWLECVRSEAPAWEREYDIRGTDGQLYTIMSRGAPVRDENGTLIGWAGLSLDFTARHRNEQFLRNAKASADKANAAKSQFLASMSHEIRTPLGAVIGFSELLLDPLQTPEQKQDCVTAIRRNGELLLALVNDILDLSKIEAGRLQIDERPLNLSEFVSEIEALFGKPMKEKGLHFEVTTSSDLPATILCDPLRLKQIIFNLLSNAMKFTSQGGVRLKLSRRDEDVVIRVQDTGVGIAPDEADRLFKPFAQADSSISRRFGGTGLGLVLARHLARALGGDVALVRSRPNEGSLFEARVRLKAIASNEVTAGTDPVNGSSMMSAATELEEIPRLDGMSILLVDDSSDNRLLLSRVLRASGAFVVTADNGSDGVTRALASDFDIVLMDLQMPVMNGYEATRRLRAASYRGPIIALTAHAMKEELDQCLTVGCDRFLVKPVDRRHLVTTVHDAIRSSFSRLH